MVVQKLITYLGLTPPSLCEKYARERDQQIRETFARLVGIDVRIVNMPKTAAQIHMPARYGGLGLQSAALMAPAAYWASCADALAMLRDRVPGFTDLFMPTMTQVASDVESLPLHSSASNLHRSAILLQTEGFAHLPTWHDLLQGQQAEPIDPFATEPGEGRKGWQNKASSVRGLFQYNLFFARLDSLEKAIVRSSAGPNAGRWLWSVPSEKALQIDSPIFRCGILRRLGLPVVATADHCEGCGRILDESGFHRTTCMRSGRVQVRHKPLIHIWRRVFREAGIHIPDRSIERLLCRTHIRRGPDDARRMDLVCPGIDGVFSGAPLFMDVTIVSPIHGNGTPMPQSATRDGAAVQRAEDKNRNVDYPDVEASPHAQLLSSGTETYGRWSNHCLVLVRQLARWRSRNVPEYLQRSTEIAYYTRWWNLLSVTVLRILADSILRPSGSDLFQAASSLSDPSLIDVIDLFGSGRIG